ncbi:MAG: ADP-glyceromanno-heptose 6-epimerase [Candidatus Margulisbacteria bacterium]|nr:ADP-glyceromanno-heptose 6-epimerase [Candidatus Margulisiibacteriota bacterium]
MNIVVTGGAGFIGSCFVWKLNQSGEKEIIIVDQAGADKEWGNLQGKVYFDYLEKELFIGKIKAKTFDPQVKAIFHIGACSSTTEQNEAYLKKNNFEYSRILCEWALDHNIPFYYASSAATYGDGRQGYSDADAQMTNLKPLNLYGQSKQQFDLWLLENKLTDKVVGFKYFNVYGPNEYHKGDMRSMVLKGFEQAKRDGVIRLFKSYRPDYKDGEQKRDFVYIKDVIEIMYSFYTNGKVKGIYNVGTGQARSWNDLAKAIFAALGLPPNIEYIEMPEIIRDKYQYFTQADLSKLKKTGLPVKFTPLEVAVADYVKTYLNEGFKRL